MPRPRPAPRRRRGPAALTAAPALLLLTLSLLAPLPPARATAAATVAAAPAPLSLSPTSRTASTNSSIPRPRLGAPTLRDSVREYYRTHRGRRLHRSLALSPHVHYDPTHILLRESAHPGGPDARQRLRDAPSDLHLLRQLGLPVPGLDGDGAVRDWVTRQVSTRGCERTEPLRVDGSASAFLVYFSRGAPTAIRPAVAFAVRKWADRFESRVAIRVCVEWTQMKSEDGSGPESSTLGATSVPFVRHSAQQTHASLVAGAAYHPALAASLTGSDPLKGGQDHVRIMLNRNIRWHIDTSARAPDKMFDMATTVLHELTHGLFMSGTLQQSGQGATYGQGPSRFDLFIQAAGRVGIARGCRDDPAGLFAAVQGGGLTFLDGVSGTQFGLYAPARFEPGSSVYHLNKESLPRDCERYGLAKSACSDLMTHELLAKYTQRNLGRTTIMLYESMRSLSPGPEAGGACVNLTVDSSLTSGAEGEDVFKLAPWTIATVAGISVVGVLLVVGVVCSTVSK